MQQPPAACQDAYGRAREAYTQSLTAEECRRINTATTRSDLVQMAQKIEKELGDMRSSKLRTFGEKAMIMERLIEGACKTSPAFGELIWGSVSFIFERKALTEVSQMITNNAAIFDEVLEFFETMTKEIELLALEEETFSTSPLVLSVLEALYCAILEFWVKAVKYYRRRARLKLFVLSSSLNKEFKVFTNKIEKQRNRLHQATVAQHNADSAFYYNDSRYIQRSIYQRELKAWLAAPNYERDFRTANELRYEGTCEWLREKQPFMDGGSYGSEVHPPDIAKVVRDTISSIARLSSDKFKDLRDRLSEEISKIENHQGMFLWAFFMCEEVKGEGNVRGLRRLLNHLPKDLDALYSRICKAIIERDESLGLSVSVLKWVMNAPRPLRFHELEEGLRLMQKDTFTGRDWFYASSDIHWSREDIVEACGNLVVYSGMEKGDTFAPVHLSAKKARHLRKLTEIPMHSLTAFEMPNLPWVQYVWSTSSLRHVNPKNTLLHLRRLHLPLHLKRRRS
ncbi:hypothetical protein H0H87_004372 [Tephrocybe sp. NHM501043]|nr:hypothetical protein H0H87_004372 [Tephrocybe sp. NHM501043]